MAITPPSDIVLDVARAADPDKYRVAAERLARLRENASSAEVFAPRAPPRVAAEPADVVDTLPTHHRALDHGAVSRPRRSLDAYGQFESFVLQTFVQSMLPKNAVSVFGKGSAGEFWKSMLAEKVGDEIARSGQVGIARRLAAGPSHPVQPTSAGTMEPPGAMLDRSPTTFAERLAGEPGVPVALPVSKRS